MLAALASRSAWFALLLAGMGSSIVSAQDADPPATAESGERIAGPIFSEPPRRSLVDQLFRDNDGRDADDEPPEPPRIWRHPLADSGIDPEERDPFVFPWLHNLFHEHSESLDDDHAGPWRRRVRRRSRVDIRNPGPDTANFPNSAYTLPKGRFTIENSPLGYYARSRASSPQYNWEYLVRYGVTDFLEFRLFSNGFTAQRDPTTTGVSPLAFDVKIHLWDEHRRFFLPALGLEAYIQTSFGSPAFSSGTQPSLNLLFDQTLPFDVNFEYNFSLTGTSDANDVTFYEFGFQFAFQKEVLPDFALFTHGFYNAASLPRIPGLNLLKDDQDSVAALVLGGGFIWNLSDRLAVFGSLNGGLNRDSPRSISYLGFAVAF